MVMVIKKACDECMCIVTSRNIDMVDTVICDTCNKEYHYEPVVLDDVRIKDDDI